MLIHLQLFFVPSGARVGSVIIPGYGDDELWAVDLNDQGLCLDSTDSTPDSNHSIRLHARLRCSSKALLTLGGCSMTRLPTIYLLLPGEICWINLKTKQRDRVV